MRDEYAGDEQPASVSVKQPRVHEMESETTIAAIDPIARAGVGSIDPTDAIRFVGFVSTDTIPAAFKTARFSAIWRCFFPEHVSLQRLLFVP